MLASDGASGGALSALITSLSPLSWLRLNDNDTNNAVVNSAASGPNGSLFSSIVSAAPVAKNTSLVSSTGLVAGDIDKSFNFAANSMVTYPAHSLSNATGWTVFMLVQQTAAAPSSSGGAIALVQLSGYVQGCPELGMIQDGAGQSRFRVLVSGLAEVGFPNTPAFYPFGTKLAVCVKKEANGVVKLFVNGALHRTSGSSPSFNYTALGVNRWGTGHYGSDTSSAKYQLPGKADELTIFNRPLTDAECISLTATA